MRIIAGKAKGKRLKTPKTGSKVRPLTERVRAALFNILVHKIEGARFLDLFAGTGAVGMEALSRGAAYAVFVELDPGFSRLIEENLQQAGLEKQGRVYNKDVVSALSMLSQEQFGIVFMGPPYDAPVLEEVLIKIAELDLLQPKGVLVVEHRKQHVIPEAIGKYALVKSARYGETVLDFFQEKVC